MKYAQTYGEVYTATTAHGAAIWLGPGNISMTMRGSFRAGTLGVLGKSFFVYGPADFNRLVSTGEYLEKIHQRLIASRSHWHLQVLGVEPEQQGQGLGSALMQPVLAKADKARLPCYLETLNEKNLPFYEHFRFQVVAQSTLPKGGPTAWSMLREPVS